MNSKSAPSEIGALLEPILGDSCSGIDLKPLGIHDLVKGLRTTESSADMVGTLRPGSYKTAQWDKVVEVCFKELRYRTKDLQLAVWLADALGRRNGFAGIVQGLEIVLGFQQRFWASLYPQCDGGGLEIRSGRLEELDRLLSERVDDCSLTADCEGVSHALWEWKQVQELIEGAGRVKKVEEREAIFADVEARKQRLAKAVAKTPREFYDDVLEQVGRCEELSESLRVTVDGFFKAEPGCSEMEDPIPNFSRLRGALEQCRVKVEDILCEKPTMATRDSQIEPGMQNSCGEELTGAKQPNRLLDPQDRGNALSLLSLIAAFFHRTEPHSPVAYLVERAVRWGQMPLEKWLEEVIGDEPVLSHLRVTLGISRK